jgi:methyl-accepting chemotaxis protein
LITLASNNAHPAYEPGYQRDAKCSGGIDSNIARPRAAPQTGSASSQVLSAAQTLSVDSGRLKNEVSKFLTDVRAA